MKISTLAEYGIPQVLIKTWEQRQGKELLPLQERAIREQNLFDGGSLIITAPTSSGKTFCGELAAARALSQRKKVIFLVPLKALAEEHFSEFKEKYEPLGIRTVISTRDRHEFDGKIEKGEYDLGVAIYEKFNQMLLCNMDILKSIDLLVIDELQMLADESRGALLEMLLLKVLNSSYDCSIIGLSAVLGNASNLASWMGAKLLIETHRPVELKQGVLYQGTFLFRYFNSGERGMEEMAPSQESSPVCTLLENVTLIVNDGEQVLVFLKNRNSCVQLATLLAETSSFSSCESAIDELASCETTLLQEPLINAVRNGMAFHHAGLSSRERSIVERYYLEGKIRVVFATTTLSLGLNLPAQTVFLETYKYRQGEYTGQPVIESLSWSDYENMCGRAGRLRFSTSSGRSIVIAGNELESEMLWKQYILGKPGELIGRLFSRQFTSLVLDLVVSGCASNEKTIVDILERAFSRVPDGIAFSISETVSCLRENELILEMDRALLPTSFGQKLTQLGMSVSTGLQIRKLFDSGEDYSQLVWLYELCDSAEGRQVYISGELDENRGQYLLRRFRSYIRHEDSVTERLREMLANPNRMRKDTLSRIRLTLALHDWMSGGKLKEIEQEYRILSGTIQTAGDTVAWLAESAFCLMGTAGISIRRRVCLKRLAFEVRYGLPVAMRKLHVKLKRSLSRGDMLLLCDNGIVSLELFMSSDRTFLSGLIGVKKVEEIMRGMLSDNQSISDACVISKPGNGQARAKLQIAGSTVRDRFRIVYCNTPLLLTPKSFKYLFKLAAQRKIDRDGWICKEDLEPGFNQARYLYNLRKEFGSQFTDGSGLIENDRRGGYRLAIPPDEIAFDFTSLSKMDDFEIAELLRHLMTL